MIKYGGDSGGLDLEVCNITFDSFGVPEDWISAVIVPLYRGKGERTECENYRGVSLLSVVRKIYAGILVDRVRRVTGGLIDDDDSWRMGENGDCLASCIHMTWFYVVNRRRT